MLGMIIAIAGQAAIAASAPVDPSAYALIDRDPVLKLWALRGHDSNRDGWLTSYEAGGAVAAFKQLADGNRDGRVTTFEFDRAKEFIIARKPAS